MSKNSYLSNTRCCKGYPIYNHFESCSPYKWDKYNIDYNTNAGKRLIFEENFPIIKKYPELNVLSSHPIATILNTDAFKNYVPNYYQEWRKSSYYGTNNPFAI